ncbi:MAG: phage/plasmid primase, P4 family [Candidatus Kaiserbacteria bacterium]|nr:phage/plasmid primase, P4 family [Candidatus Kaiserbacteria bacterium]
MSISPHKNKKESPLELLNKELATQGLTPINDTDTCPERSAYLAHMTNPDYGDKDWVKTKKSLEVGYVLAFHTFFATTHPYLLYEIGEDSSFWVYNEETGIYDDINFSQVRSLLHKLLIDEGLIQYAVEKTAKDIIHKYKSQYRERGISYDDFDANPEWFHAENGWVNLQTNAFKEHSPKRVSRRVSAVSYDPEATCPLYDAFLDTQMQLKPDQVRAIDQFSGLLLTPDITKQKMLVLIGKPGCGKSTLLDLWQDVLGDLATQNSLHEIASDSFRFRGSTLVGKTLCWFDEVEVTRSNVGNSLINLITGQQIRVERKGINGIITSQNKLKCVLTANTLPRSAEMGIYRRMILIYLNYSFYDNMTDNKNIRNLLKAESSGVLNRMLRGLKDITKHGGFTEIEGHSELIEEYKSNSNTVAEFLEEHFNFDYDAPKLSTKTLLEAYKNYASDKYVDSLTPARFGVLLGCHGLMKFHKITTIRGSKGVRMWAGLKLKDWYEINSTGLIREKSDF